MDPLGTGSRGVVAGHMFTTQTSQGSKGSRAQWEEGLDGVCLGHRVDSNPIPGFVPSIQGDLDSFKFLKCEIKVAGLAYQTAD